VWPQMPIWTPKTSLAARFVQDPTGVVRRWN